MIIPDPDPQPWYFGVINWIILVYKRVTIGIIDLSLVNIGQRVMKGQTIDRNINIAHCTGYKRAINRSNTSRSTF